MKLKPSQRDSLARAALLDGLILAWEQGIGKSIAAFAWPFLKRARRVLIVCPSDLQPQFRDSAAEHFGIPLPVLRTPDDLKKWKIDKPQPPLRKGQMPKFFIIGNEAMTRNGADEWPSQRDMDGKIIIGHRERKRLIEYHAKVTELSLARILGREPDLRQYMEGVGETGPYVDPRSADLTQGQVEPNRQPITCVWKPCMARLIAEYSGRGGGFDCIVIDEATSLQGESLTSLGLRLLSPKYRLLLTGTPIKNQLESIFYLGWWACGGADSPTPRFPYGKDGRSRFARHHQEHDRFLTREEEWKSKHPNSKNSKFIERKTPRVCNVHRLWKFLLPFVVRLRKESCGEDIVPCTIRPITVPFGTAQAAIYENHLKNPPISPANNPKVSLPQFAATGIQLNILRQVALCPDANPLEDVISNANPSRLRSYTPWTPKLGAILSLVADLLDQGEQIAIGSPFKHFSGTLYSLLKEARVDSLLLDSRVQPADRGLWLRAFKSKSIPVLIAGQESMGRGHSLENCSHLVMPSLSWAFDTNDQFKHRVWRMNSPKEVFIYILHIQGSVEDRMAELYADKGDTAQLTLDGRLFPDQVEEIDPEILLATAIDRFSELGETVDEHLLEDGWPKLRQRLGWSMERYREFHPPIVKPVVDPDEIAAATDAAAPHPENDFNLAQLRAKEAYLARQKKRKRR
jgi:hypothetical protein